MNKYACQYAIVRFLPYAETGEFANVGVVLACPATGFFGARLMPARKTARIAGFFEQLEKRVYRQAMAYFQQELDRVANLVEERGVIEPALVKDVFAGLVRPREALLRFGEVRVILAERPDETLDKLFATVVERDFADKEYHDQLLVRSVRETLRKADLNGYFQKAMIGNDDLHFEAPFVHSRDGRPRLAIKPLDLAKAEPSKVYEIGGRWLERTQRLQRHCLLPDAMMFAVNLPAAGQARVLNAAKEIIGDFKESGFAQAVAIDDKTAIAEFARGVSTH